MFHYLETESTIMWGNQGKWVLLRMFQHKNKARETYLREGEKEKTKVKKKNREGNSKGKCMIRKTLERKLDSGRSHKHLKLLRHLCDEIRALAKC